MTEYIINWQQSYQAGKQRCGGKGWNLARLHYYGFSIPKGGVIVSDLYNELVAQSPFKHLIQQLASIKTADLFAQEQQALIEKLQSKFFQASLSPSFILSLQSFLESQGLQNSFISVRSSVNHEDGDTASFAGIHDSVLNICGSDAIEQAILQCFASVWSIRAISYRRKMNIADLDVAVALVINEMIPAQVAGVAFSCEPVTGRHDVISINANFGLGESVVSGAVEPDQYRLHRYQKNIIDSRIGKKQKIYRAKEQGGCAWEPGAPDKACLTEMQLKKLALLCDRIFHTLGQGDQHQDIEWVFDGKDFVVLQSRPVTAIKKAVCPEISDQQEMWSNGNFRDAVPMVMPDLVAEFCDFHINDILHKNFKYFYIVDPALRFARRFKGRFYCNASLLQWLWYDAVDFSPEKLNINLGGHQALINIDKKYQTGVLRKFTRIWRGLKFFSKLAQYRKRASDIFAAETAYAEQQLKVNLGLLDDKQLIEHLNNLDSHLIGYNQSFIMLTSQSGAIFMLIQVLEKYFNETAAYQMANTLMARQGDLTSANHGYQLRELAKILQDDNIALEIINQDSFNAKFWQGLLPEGSKFKQAFSKFINDYGHRAIYEIDLSRPRWREDSDYLFSCIQAYIKSSALNSWQDENLKVNEQYELAWEEIKKNVPRYLHGQIKKHLASAIEGAALKEMSKSVYIRLMEPMRLTLLEIGRRLVERGVLSQVDDVFFCVQSELDAIFSGEWDGQQMQLLIQERKNRKLEQERIAAVDVIYDDIPHRLSVALDKSNSTLQGIGSASGQAQGIARLIQTPQDGTHLQQGDVLVAPSTDPAWTPLFLNASAIVMETGGYLSHGSIVAREYGIPAVVNVAGVFSAIEEGDDIVVNGDEGFVKIIS